MEVLTSVSSMKGPCNGVILDSHISHHISAKAQELQSAAKMDCPTAAPSIFRDVFKGNEMKEFQSVQVGR